jgi:hypothetical protein
MYARLCDGAIVAAGSVVLRCLVKSCGDGGWTEIQGRWWRLWNNIRSRCLGGMPFHCRWHVSPLTRRPLSGPLFFIHHEHDMLPMYRMDHGSVEELQLVTCENGLALDAISGANDE